MTRRDFLALGLLLGCTEEEIEMNKKKKLLLNWWLNSGGGSTTPWYLAGGIAESTDYTIYDPLSSATLTDSYINLANPGVRNATVGVAPTLSSTGWTFNGTTQYLNSNVYADGNSTVIILVQDFAVNTGYAVGALDASGRRLGVRPNSSGNPRWEFSSSTLTNGYNISGGIMAISQNGIYINGYKYTAPAAWATTQMLTSLFIGAHDNNGTPTTFYNGKIGLFAHYNTTLSDAQIIAVTNAIYNKYVLTPADSYQNVVLASNPTYYLPLNTKSGFTFYKELILNSFASTVTGNIATSGNVGLHGECVTFPGLQTNLIRPNLDISSVLYNDEFSVSMWVKYSVYPTGIESVRHSNQYTNGTTEYIVLELRAGPAYGIYQREAGGVSDNITGINPPVPSLGSWSHIVYYNSKSQGIRGVYFNGVNINYSRNLLPGFTGGGYVTSYYPELFSTLNGSAQHISFYNHALTQSEVNALYQP